MPAELHETSLIALLAIGFVLALLLGLAANMLRVSPIVGYLLAGTSGNLWVALLTTLAKVAVFAALALVVGTRLVPWAAGSSGVLIALARRAGRARPLIRKEPNYQRRSRRRCATGNPNRPR
jgi:predicted Kef-type K+ transport protein